MLGYGNINKVAILGLWSKSSASSYSANEHDEADDG